MARKARIVLPGVPQHVIQRGNNRQACFYAEEDYRFYLECLEKATKKFDCEIHAYVLMTNHVHLLVTSPQAYGISQMMQSVGRRYVRYINHTYRRSGTLWEGRYKSSLVQDERYLLTCYRYIELNPVRARMVEAPGDYKWSSYRNNGFGQADTVITPHEQYLMLGNDKDQRSQYYRELFRHHLDDKQLHEIREAVNQELVLGNGRFKDEIEQVLQRRVRPGKPGRPCVKEEGEYYGVY